jgi:cytochrome c553
MGKLAAIVFLLLSIGFVAQARAEVPDGAFMFNQRCGKCHEPAALMPRLMKLPDDNERRAYLEKFLTRHHARDEQERKLIVEYLVRYQPR